MTILVNDISNLTTLSIRLLEKLNKTAMTIIGHSVYESLQESSPDTHVDLGYGTLTIHVDTDTVRYRFVPSMELERLVTKTVTTKTSPLKVALDKNLSDKLQNTYRELL